MHGWWTGRKDKSRRDHTEDQPHDQKQKIHLLLKSWKPIKLDTNRKVAFAYRDGTAGWPSVQPDWVK